MDSPTQILTLLDWPNLIGGAAISLVIGFSTWIVQGLWATYVASKDLPYRVSGKWYSAEYDPKGELPRHRRNTLLEVRVARRLRGWIHLNVVRLPIQVPGASLGTRRSGRSWSFYGQGPGNGSRLFQMSRSATARMLSARGNVPSPACTTSRRSSRRS